MDLIAEKPSQGIFWEKDDALLLSRTRAPGHSPGIEATGL